MVISIKGASGQAYPLSLDKLETRLKEEAAGLPQAETMISQVVKEAAITLYDGMSEQELDKALIQASTQHIKDSLDFDHLSAKLFLSSMYRQVLGEKASGPLFQEAYRSSFVANVKAGIAAGLLSIKLEKFDLEKLAQGLEIGNDELFTYTGLSTMSRRYMLRGRNQELLELPQYFWMRVAMGLSWNENDPTTTALAFYGKMSRLEYIAGGSTNINAGSVQPRLSNCFLMEMEDNIGHIGKTVSDVLKLSKATGGIGLSVTKLRAAGSPISTNNTFSSGPVPFLHIIDSAIRAISRAGKKMGALCFYMENWHLDFNDYLDLKQNAGDDYRRTRTANTAVYISDEFMKRVNEDDYWYLFDPGETGDLIDLYGEAFSRRYRQYCAMAEAGELKLFRKVKAKDQFRQIIVSLQATSHPWLTFKDAINVRALNNNTGTIYGSNLCTEITLPTDEKNVAVCNIMSINLARHFDRDKGELDFARLAESTRLAIRQLDNLVDINEAPIGEAINFDRHNRAVGLGVMGLADIFERYGLPYDSQESYELADTIMEHISYQAIDASADLAQERGSYDNFPGSRWEQGYVPVDTVAVLEKERGLKVTLSRRTQLDWNKLREKVKRGMRNSTLLAIAPTANIGLVAGTSTGIDPRFAQIFSRNTLGGKYLELNPNLVEKLEALGIWEKVREPLLANYGDLAAIEGIPEEIKRVYKDSFSVDPLAYVEVAARAQKWVDQAISRNMYLATRDAQEIMDIYYKGWESGLKTTYYLHMKPRHSAEQSTIKVNKSTALGKKGFGLAVAVATAPKQEEVPVAFACPLDPQERAQCDSCQ